MFPPIFLLLFGCLSVSLSSIATAVASQTVGSDRMIVDSNTLIFNTDAVITAANSTPSIIYEDVNLFGDLLMNHPEVDTVVVSGAGGSTSAAYDIAQKITEFGLTTIARNNCSSACTLLFLAGSERRLEKGARLGFHRSTTGADVHRDFYERNKADMGWEDEFAYAKHSHEDGQVDARDFIAYAVERGVSLEFALETLTYSPHDMWYPSAEELRGADVVSTAH